MRAPTKSKVALGDSYSKGNARIRRLNKDQSVVRDEILKNDYPDDYESINCLCLAENSDILLSEVERHGLPYRKVICAKCGLLRVSPRWKQERYNHFYENQYRKLYNTLSISKETYAKNLSDSPFIKEIGNWVIRSNEKFGRSSNPLVVELGSGGGWILSNLPLEWKRTGYDVDHEYLELGRKVFQLNMKYGLFQEALDEIKMADVVVLSHVVEHFLNPIDSLKDLWTNMKTDALLLIEVPGIFRIHSSNLDPMSYMQNAHTFTFCAHTLKYVCEMAGFKVLAINEHCRAICLKSKGSNDSINTENEVIATQIIEYLKACERFYARYEKLNNAFLRPIANIYKKLFEKSMTRMVPTQYSIG